MADKAKDAVEKAKDAASAVVEKAKDVAEAVADKVQGLVEVNLVKGLKQESVGSHTIFTPDGAVNFTDGVAKTTKEQVEYLRKLGFVD